MASADWEVNLELEQDALSLCPRRADSVHMAATTRVSLSPSPGFCVKSSALNSVAFPADVPLSSSHSSPRSPITIPTGLKIFVNIAWDPNVPPPQDGSDAAIDRAMADPSAHLPDDVAQWFVPLIVSDPRSDSDKGLLPLQPNPILTFGDPFISPP